ncbi:MAG: hypothetical protein ACYTXL_08430 [Nostoc sp.]
MKKSGSGQQVLLQSDRKIHTDIWKSKTTRGRGNTLRSAKAT